jgi:hypothetical protein
MLSRCRRCTPSNPNKVFALLIHFYTGVSHRLLLCSPAGRCGLIGLSQFLQFTAFSSQPFSAVFAVFVPVVPLYTHTARPCLSQARAVILLLRSTSLHSVLSFQHLLSLQNASKQKTPPALPKRQPSAALILRAVCCQRPCSTRRRLAPLHYACKKTTPLSLRLFFTAPFRLKAALPVSV